MASGAFGRDFAKIARLLEIFREEVDPEMPMQMAHAFLCVAVRPGLTMHDLGIETGLSQSSVSRNVQALGEWHRAGKIGYDLLQAVDDPVDTRRKVVFLSTKGTKLASKLVSLLRDEDVEVSSTIAQDYVDGARKRLQRK